MADGERGGGRTRRRVKLGQDIRHVAHDGAVTDEQRVTDLLVGEPLRHLLQYVQFAGR